MQRINKKGFTLVELVIVIAVIGILAGVLIGTFATVIGKANESKALQEWKSTVEEVYIEYVADNHKVPTKIDFTNNVLTFGQADTAPTADVTQVLSNVNGKNVVLTLKYDSTKQEISGYTVTLVAQ